MNNTNSPVRVPRWIFFGWLLSLVLAVSAAPAQAQSANDEYTNGLIVKFRSDRGKGKHLAAPGAARMAELHSRAGEKLSHHRVMSGEAHVMRLPSHRKVSDVEEVAKRLRADPDVEYAVPDRLMKPTAVPNDQFYDTLQWPLKAPAVSAGGANLPGAWDVSTGDPGLVIAVLDTGILPNHPDLDAARLVPGYDFVPNLPFPYGCTTNCVSTMDNDATPGPDNDPSDPGDWLAYNELYPGSFPSNSSWHGSHVAGIIGAKSNNGQGMAGINWNSKILPVRVLGKGGGYESVIIDGMRWAAGFSVPNTPVNANPAKILNMSLGGAYPCSAPYQDAVNVIVAANVTIVAAAGNNGVNVANSSPASCAGVIAVAAVGARGEKSWYSNYGAGVALAAPGGNSIQTPSGLDVQMVSSLMNTGAAGPDPLGYYIGQKMGTSQAAPHVAGIASLLLSVNPTLTPAQIKSTLTSTARPFPVGTGVGATDCNTSMCGAGIVNAAAALASLGAPVMVGSPSYLGISPYATDVAWTTNEDTTGKVEYGPTTAYGLVADSWSWLPPLTTQHYAGLYRLTPNTLYNYRLIFKDAAGNKVVTGNYIFTTPPMPAVAIAAPAANAMVSGGAVSLAVNVNSVVVGVQYKLDGADLGAEVTAAPFTLSWNTLATANGAHVLSAVAREIYGNKTTSAGVPVTVDQLPVISGVNLYIVGPYGVNLLYWTTNEASDSELEYGPTTSYGSVLRAVSLTTSHSFSVNGLASNTLYHFRVKSRDAGGNQAVSGDYTFTTLPAPSVAITAPASGAVVSGGIVPVSVSVNSVVTSVQYQLDGVNLGARMTAPPFSTILNSTLVGDGGHTLTAVAYDGYNNTAVSNAYMTTENFPPVLSAPSTEVLYFSWDNARISWTSNENTDAQVEYGLTTAYGRMSALNPSLSTLHTISLSSLPPNTVYYYRLRSRDAAGKLTVSGDYRFATQSYSSPDMTAPTSPAWSFISPLAALPNSNHSLYWGLSSDVGTGVNYYEISRSANNGASWSVVASVFGGGIYGYTYSPVPGVPVGKYLYRVRAADMVMNWSAPSASVPFYSMTPSTMYGYSWGYNDLYLYWSAPGISDAVVNNQVYIWGPFYDCPADGSAAPYCYRFYYSGAANYLYLSGLRPYYSYYTMVMPQLYDATRGSYYWSVYSSMITAMPTDYNMYYNYGGESLSATSVLPSAQKSALSSQRMGVLNRQFRPAATVASVNVTTVAVSAPLVSGAGLSFSTSPIQASPSSGTIVALDSLGDVLPHRSTGGVPLVLGYKTSELTVGLKPEDLGLYRWDASAGRWSPAADATHDKVNRTFSVTTTDPGSYQILTAAAAGEALALGEVFSFPNPAKGVAPTIHAEVGLADSAEIKVFNAADQLVHSVTLAQPDLVNGKYAYDYQWNVAGMPSGVYLYTVKAKKDGKTISASAKKLALVK